MVMQVVVAEEEALPTMILMNITQLTRQNEHGLRRKWCLKVKRWKRTTDY